MARLCRGTYYYIYPIIIVYKTGKQSFNKHNLKGYTTVLRFNRFQERRHHDVIGTQSCQSKVITQWVSQKHSLMDMNTITTCLDTSHARGKGTVSVVCLNMSKQKKREKEYSWQCFYFVESVYFPFIDTNRT